MKIAYQTPEVIVEHFDLETTLLNNLSVRNLEGDWTDED